MARNRWTASIGINGRHGPDYAYSLNYDVTLVRDAHSTWDTDLLTAPQIIAHHNKVLGGWFVRLKETTEIEFDTAP
jgi:hypothetical protein